MSHATLHGTCLGLLSQRLSEALKAFGCQEVPHSFVFGYMGPSLEDTHIINSVQQGGLEDTVECIDKVVLA